MIGQTISHYRITAKLGEGGMGVVYEAEDLDLGVTRALKFLPADTSTDQRSLTRLKREARAAAALEHPHICPVHEIGHDDGQTFIVMSRLEGETLGDRLASNGPLPVDDALRIARDVGDALNRAHGSGIIHRDIKPSNIMLTESSGAVVMDFGLATSTDLTKMTRTGTTLGTAAYMSPEQSRGEAVDARADIWSLGAVLYECLTGQAPFPGENLAAVIHGLQHEDPASVTHLNPAAPPELELVIGRALAKDPDQRFATARLLLDDLESIAAGRGISDGTRRSTRRPSSGLRRWLLPASIAALVVVTGVAVWQLMAPPEPEIRALAVLPIADLSGDPEQEYFADGMTEALITRLQLLTADRLRVIGRTSVMRYKEKDLTLPEIADELDVDVVVEASVLRTEDRVRIIAKLMRARPEEEQMWANTYERQIPDILLLHDEIAREIAAQIQIALATSITDPREVDPQAYEEFLVGRYIVDGSGDVSKALPHFERAMELDPDFAPAWREAAHCTFMPFHHWPFPREPVVKARELIDHAIALDPNDAESWFVLGHILYEHEFEMEDADEAFQRALELNPSQGRGLLVYAFYCTATGRLDEAADITLSAIASDPFDYLILGRGLGPLMSARRWEDFENEIDRRNRLGADLDKERSWAEYSLDKDYQRALDLLSKKPVKDPERRSPYTNELFGSIRLRQLAGLHWANGDVERARELAREWLSVTQPDSISQMRTAEIHAILGDNDRAIACIDTAWARKDIMVVRINDPAISALSILLANEPRFEELLKKFGLKT